MALITWSDDCLQRYPYLLKVSSSITPDSAYVAPAETRLNSALGRYFTVPFSSNNATAKDLAIDWVYLIAGSHNIKEADALRKQIMARVRRLVEGVDAMLADDGTEIAPTSTSSEPWSNTKDYHSAFGMLDVENFAVDSSQIQDELSDRGY